MSDRYDQDTILGYVEGELDDDQRASFESVIAQDHELRNLVAQMKLDRQALRSLGSKPAPIGMVDQVIQAQERAALLGEPEVPEPLPMVLPVSRIKLHRVLAYAGIAAVLLLSAAIVIPTLMPSDLLDRQSPIAQLDSDADAPATKRPRRGPGYALLDEDAAYDQAATRSLARSDAGPAPAAKEAKPDAPTAAATAMVEEAKTPEVGVVETSEVKTAEAPPTPVAADTELAKADTKDRAAEPAAPALAMIERADTPKPHLPTRDTATEPKAEALAAKANSEDSVALLSEPVKPEADAPLEKVELAKAAPIDPFTGYASTDVDITDNSQLLINAASPTLARRDLRDWAIANSAVVQEPSANAGLGGARATTNRTFAQGLVGKLDASDTANAAEEATQLVVEIDPSQVPQLLAYLNRNADQRAELVAQPDEITPATSRDSERARNRRAERLAREAERNQPADKTTALTNSMVDTKSPWPKPNLVTGLVSTQPDADTRNAKADRDQPKEETATDTASAAKDAAPAPGSLTPGLPGSPGTPVTGTEDAHVPADPADTATTKRQPKPFDWGNLLDAAINKPAPLLQPEPRQRVRLTVIITQVPTDAPAKEH